MASTTHGGRPCRLGAIELADSFQALCRRILKWGGLTLLVTAAWELAGCDMKCANLAIMFRK